MQTELLQQLPDKVLAITHQIMDELLGDDRDPRAFRAKFPEEVLQESLAGQLWFGAECLAAGSSILNREAESTEMRPLAKAVTRSLDNQEHEMQEMICVLFSETVQRALKIGLLDQEQVDSFDPALMFSIPRLAIITGLVIYDKGPLNMTMPAEQLSEMFRPFRTLLIKIRDLLRTLNKSELYQLEKLLCTNEDIHLKCDFNCDDEKLIRGDEELVISDCCSKEKLPSFYSVVNEDESGSEWHSSEEDREDVVGSVVVKEDNGDLPNDAPLTDSFISSDDEFTVRAAQTQDVDNKPEATSTSDRQDSGIGTENTSLDRTPDSETQKVESEAASMPLTERYSENWEELQRKKEEQQPSCSRSTSGSSGEDKVQTAGTSQCQEALHISTTKKHKVNNSGARSSRSQRTSRRTVTTTASTSAPATGNYLRRCVRGHFVVAI
uniref:Lateral signaling target protein 2 homolog n=1 Tax=Phlebotomus papatasi TaxID=29031 RepID=A0A1B0DBT5_PHLPP